jgi:hypothetical protein
MTALPKLDLKGIKGGSPVNAFLSEPEAPKAPQSDGAAETPTTRPTTRPARPRPAAPEAVATEAQPPRLAFYGAGAVEQTSIAIEPTLYATLTDVARVARVPSNTLFLASIHAALPATAGDAVKAIVGERATYPGRRREYTPRVPLALRARIDELVAGAREHVTKATRADLVNPALRSGLPTDAHDAAGLVAAWERNRELAQLPTEFLGIEAVQ